VIRASPPTHNYDNVADLVARRVRKKPGTVHAMQASATATTGDRIVTISRQW
jgi:hypothetical protein